MLPSGSQADWTDAKDLLMAKLDRLLDEDSLEYGNPGVAYRALFDMFHLKRLSENVDTFGSGMNLANIEPTFIITFTGTLRRGTPQDVAEKVGDGTTSGREPSGNRGTF
jgi:hypothetical protein